MVTKFLERMLLFTTHVQELEATRSSWNFLRRSGESAFPHSATLISLLRGAASPMQSSVQDCSAHTSVSLLAMECPVSLVWSVIFTKNSDRVPISLSMRGVVYKNLFTSKGVTGLVKNLSYVAYGIHWVDW